MLRVVGLLLALLISQSDGRRRTAPNGGNGAVPPDEATLMKVGAAFPYDIAATYPQPDGNDVFLRTNDSALSHTNGR